MKKKVYIYKLYERFWHWSQMALILFLMFTGFEIHGSYTILGFENAVRYHNVAAISLLLLIVFTIFWHFTTGEWRQYIPTRKNIKAQLDYYLFGIFRNAPHPFRKTILSKLNPLQRIVYFVLKIVMIPLMVITGILYMLYRFPLKGKVITIFDYPLEPVALLHTFGAYLLVAFVIAHVYLTTTGETIFSNIKAMITGYEEIETDENISDDKNNISENTNEFNIHNNEK